MTRRTDEDNRKIYDEIYEKDPEYGTYIYGRNSEGFVPQGCTLLDVGCGKTRYVRNLLDTGQIQSGLTIDISPIAVRYQIIGHWVASIVMSVTNIGFNEDAFQVVTCFDVLEHLEPGNVDQAISELIRVASDLIILTVNPYPSERLGHELHRTVQPYQWWSDKFKALSAVLEVTEGFYDQEGVRDGETGNKHYIHVLRLK